MTEKIDFQSLKRSTPISRILDHYGIRLKPPLPMHSSSSAEASFMVNTNKNVWSCHSQSCMRERKGTVGGNILDLVCLMEGCSLRSAALLIQSRFGDSVGQAHPIVAISPKVASEERNAPLSFQLRQVDPTHVYLTERGISTITAQSFGVGLYTGPGTLSRRVVIPIRDAAGSTVAYAGRSIDGSSPRYRFPSGFRKGLELFNLHRYTAYPNRGRVVVVEGFFDTLRVFQAGFPVVALMGSTISQTQSDLIAKYFSEVVLLFDGDDAGRTGTHRATELLRLHTRLQVVSLPDGVQPDQLEPNQIRGLIK